MVTLGLLVVVGLGARVWVAVLFRGVFVGKTNTHNTSNPTKFGVLAPHGGFCVVCGGAGATN